MWERFATIKTLREEALEERLAFIRIIKANPKIKDQTKKDLEPYYTAYNEEWKRRRIEANNNHN